MHRRNVGQPEDGSLRWPHHSLAVNELVMVFVFDFPATVWFNDARLQLLMFLIPCLVDLQVDVFTPVYQAQRCRSIIWFLIEYLFAFSRHIPGAGMNDSRDGQST